MKTDDLSAEETGLSKEEIKDLGAVYTPSELVNKMLDGLGIDWDNPPQDKTFLDPTCGNGQFLVQLAKRGIPIHNIFGLDLMDKNIKRTKERLREIYGDTDEVNYHLDRNIEQGDALTNSYDFYEKWTGFDEW